MQVVVWTQIAGFNANVGSAKPCHMHCNALSTHARLRG